jgi:hypothetical protein
MWLLLAAAAFAANNSTTFVVDPAYTKPPFGGMEQLFVEPATVQGQLKPFDAAQPGEKVKDAPAPGAIVFTNPMSQWGELTVNGVKIGIIGPYATCKLEGVTAGWYKLEVKVPTGFARTFAVQAL